MPYKDYPIFTDPATNNKLWRYITLNKFESVLKEKALFFCRADKFSDPFEGASPLREIENRIEEEKKIMKLNNGKDLDREIAANNAEMLSNFQKKYRSLVLISCWHYNTNESDAMWQLYLKDNEGVAIQTNPTKLKKSFDSTDLVVNAGKVRYLDYQNDIYYNKDEFPIRITNIKTPFIHKRLHFKHEQEYRALVDVQPENGFDYDWNVEKFTNGKMVSVDVNTLIEKVIIPPNADNDFLERVKKLILDYGFDFPVTESEMNEKPYF